MKRRLSLLQNVFLSFYWFTSNVQWTALIIIVVPREVLFLVGKQHSTSVLSVLVIIGSLVATFVQPWGGLISDRLRHRWGRRRPYNFWGTAGNILGLLMMGYAGRDFWLFVGGYMVVQFSSNLAQAAYQALIPDLVNHEQRGLASGFMGFMTQFAIIFGALLPRLLGDTTVYWAMAAFLVAGWAVTQWGVHETDSRDLDFEGAPKHWLRDMWISPRQHPDFWWVFGTRLLVMLGFATLENYLFYYLKFTVGIANPESVVFDILALLTLGSLLSVLAAGWLSDRLQKRKAMVVIGGLLMGMTALVFVFTNSIGVILVMGTVFGFGYGIYMSTDWALAVDVLPPGRSEGRSMGLWQASFNLAQVGAGLIAGALVTPLASIVHLSMAYRMLFIVTFLYFVLGSLFIQKVKSAQ
ncbi:MAG: MFS transporter [Sulfobacillus sp.]